MLRQMAWNTFKNTGNINTFLELIEVENIEKNLRINEKFNVEKNNIEAEKQDGNIEIKGNSNIRT